jgi:valyl-tRNA synthetase
MKFKLAGEQIYDFTWHQLADIYIESIKDRLRSDNKKDKTSVISILRHVYIHILKLLHPFMPFVTETIWQEMKDTLDIKEQLLITSRWPKIK